jgi:F-type H+-transporting ATPase subunit epsilon
VLPGRAPLVGRLGYGELRIRRGTQMRSFFVDGGFVQVRANTITVLTARALRAEDIDTTTVTHALQAALAPAPNAQAREAQVKAQERARSQLRVARHREESAARG